MLSTGSRSRLFFLAALAGASSCYTPPQFLPPGQAGGPQGLLQGTVTYSGPLPCTEQGDIVGAAILFVFDTRLLPPPDGLGTSAASLGVVPGDTLFAGVEDRLTFNADGSKWCPDPSTPAVEVSADWSIAPLAGAVYEVRGFYDLAGTFDPTFSITRLPVQGDIAGGAIDNVSAVLQGAEPVYRQIQLGTSDGMGDYTIPSDGAAIDGVTVTLGLPLSTGLPIFYSSAVAYSSNTCVNGVVTPAKPGSTDPTQVTMPSDYTLPVFDPENLVGTQDSIIRITLAAGVPASEAAVAQASPYDLPVVTPPPSFAFTWQDVNGDGMLNLAQDHPAATNTVPSLFPLSIFNKLGVSDPPASTDDLLTQSAPAVIIQGLTLYKSLEATAFWPNNMPPNIVKTDTSVIVGITPAVVCLDPTDFSPNATATLVITHLKDCMGNDVVTDMPATLAQLAAQFGRPVTPVEACLPQGRYAMNLVYGSGQAWTVPNEAGVCQALEPESSDGTQCVAAAPAGAQRTRLQSQDVVLTVGPPQDPAYCAQPAHQTPAACCPSGGC